jgi:2'-hydroxyisoflavone reductase
MSLSRRGFLGAGVGAASLVASSTSFARQPAPTAIGSSGANKSLLVLGGTRFLGPAIVDVALAEGYEVTLFNRGKSNPEAYPELEQLRGDRDTGELDALKGRKWDMVVDTSGYVPAHTRAAAEILRDSVEHYVFISTCSVYADGDEKNVTEEHPVGTMDAAASAEIKTIRDVFRSMAAYGPLKAECEASIEEVMPGRVTSLRPGVIAGRDDPGDRYLYWAIRVEQGGEVLSPGNPNALIQFIDVKDLGRMSVEFGAARKAGLYNSIGFAGPVTFQEWLHGLKIVLGADASFTWASDEFLLEHEVRPFQELPMWLPPDAQRTFVNTKGIAAGMTFRPLGKTTEDMVAWHHEVRDDTYQWGVYGMKPARERELLAEWKKRQDG